MFLYLLAAAAVLPVIALVVGAYTGRVKVNNCCATADPSRDLRMRVADEPVDTRD